MKDYLLIDGENFVHSLVHVLRSKKLVSSRQQLSRLDFNTLFSQLNLTDGAQIFYYSTKIELPDESSSLYKTIERMRAWNAKWIPYIANQQTKIIKAGLLKARSSKRCPHCKKRTDVLIEKGVDVRIGVDIATMAAKGSTIFVLSSDSDLIPAINSARAKGVGVTYVAFEGGVNKAIGKVAAKTIILDKTQITKAFKEVNK